jgi:hypothetical protein
VAHRQPSSPDQHRLNFGAIAQAACAESTFTLTGVNAGDTIAPGWPAILETGLAGNMIATSQTRLPLACAIYRGATIDPAAQTFKATAIH